MTHDKFILAIDQGTTSSRAIIFNHSGKIAGLAQEEFKQLFPNPGWVEHDPEEIWDSQLKVIKEAVLNAGISADRLAAIGITNQRETALVWDRNSGKPICNAIVWQDRRTAGFCDHLKAEGHEQLIREKTGLVIDAYFSASKWKWILDNVPGAKDRAN
ncbi:MAG: FGGY family carbohydrate kinase, partial [Desulfocapsaceae bacterium]